MVQAVASDDWTALSRPLERALGKRTAKALERLGLKTVEDLVLHFPFRLAHRGELMPISQVREGESVTVVAQVLSASLRPMNARKGFLLTVRIADGRNELGLTFFGKAMRPLQYHERRLQAGTIATFSGTISSYRGELQLNHPEYEIYDDEPDLSKISQPIPIYHATEKLPSWHIERAIAAVLPTLTAADFPDPLPAGYRALHHLPSRFDAIHALHQPPEDKAWEQANARMKHEEAFVLQTSLAQRAAQARGRKVSAFPATAGGLLQAFDERLPFALTDGQVTVGGEISSEIATCVPMQRLLQGDVGSGKTIVAVRAMLQVVDAGGQAAFLVPTEVLAWQHLRTIEGLMGELAMGGQLGSSTQSTRVEILTGSLTAGQRRKALARIASGEAGIVVGTHALLSEDVQIPFLGLAVIDEQHRFGVDQRDSLASGVHTLVMTATPIPRTIAMSVFGDLDVSTLRELPQGRAGVTSTLVPLHNERWMDRAWERAAEEVASGGRVFVVCPRIDADQPEDAEQSEESEKLEDAEQLDAFGDGEAPTDASRLASSRAHEQEQLNVPGTDIASKDEVHSAVATHDFLTGRLPGITIGMLHGRMKPDEKSMAMERFASGQAPILVATTVVEVGVDVPDATLMIILDADRFGLSQLHQLRGRIGRGTKPGLCLAVTGVASGTLAHDRVEAFVSTTDGFELAEKDLELRSEGDVLGASQSGGQSHLRFLSVVRDAPTIEVAREASRALVHDDPDLTLHPELAAAVATLDTGRAHYMEKG